MCQRQILDIRWWAHVSNAEVLQRSGFSTIGGILRHRRLSLFGHVARLDAGVGCSASDGVYMLTVKFGYFSISCLSKDDVAYAIDFMCTC